MPGFINGNCPTPGKLCRLDGGGRSPAKPVKDRIERNGGRRRKTTIVALARKLLVALWKYVSAGVVIEGAMIRPA
jgi:hypothetical protein